MSEASLEISWNVDLAIRPGALDAFRALTLEMVDAARGEPGAMDYERYVSADGRSAAVWERWRDSASALSHLTLFADRFAARYSQLVERRRFTVYGTPSIELRALLTRFGATEFLAPLAGFAHLTRRG